MSIALFGHATEHPDDPFVMVASLPLDQRLLPSEVAGDKARREDLQNLACLQALAARGQLRHPIATAAPATDPPDRVWTIDSQSFGVELTQLTVEQLREDLAKARHLGRLLQTRLDAARPSYPHLVGRVASVTWMPDPERPSRTRRVDLDSTANALADALREDRGYVGQGMQVDAAAPLPAQWPNDRGFYGRIAGEYQLQVQKNGDTDGAPIATGSANGSIRLSEARTGLRDRIAAKDDARNDILVVSTGMVDSQGYICPLDGWLFRMLVEHGVGELPEPAHLKGILLHDFGSGDFASIYERRGALLPWSPPQS